MEALISRIINQIHKTPSDITAYEDLFSLCRNIEEKGDFTLAHDTNGILRRHISTAMKNRYNVKDMFELYKKSLLFDAPHFFDSYLLYEEFWEKDAEMVKAYRQAERIKRKQRDWDLWLQGRYFYDALCAVSPILHAFAKSGTEPVPYLEEPYPRTKEDLKKIQDKIMKQNAESFRALVALKNEERRQKNGHRSDN